MSTPTKRQVKPTKAIACAAADLTAGERRLLAAFRSIPGSDSRDMIVGIVETFADLCPRDKRPALHLVHGGAA